MSTHIKRLLRNVHAVLRPVGEGGRMNSIQLSLFGDSRALSLQISSLCLMKCASRFAVTSRFAVKRNEPGMPGGLAQAWYAEWCT